MTEETRGYTPQALRLFLVDSQTVSRQEREALAEPETEANGTLVKARPPLRGYDDVVKRLVQMLDANGILQRFRAIGQYGSIAVIERFWRTLKELLGIRLWPPLSRAHLEARTELALAYYPTLRPHQGLDGAINATVPKGTDPAAVDLDKAVELLAKSEAKLRRAQGKDPRAKKKTTRRKKK